MVLKWALSSRISSLGLGFHGPCDCVCGGLLAHTPRDAGLSGSVGPARAIAWASNAWTAHVLVGFRVGGFRPGFVFLFVCLVVRVDCLVSVFCAFHF